MHIVKQKKVDVADALIGAAQPVASLAVRTDEAASMLGVSKETLNTWRRDGIGPRYAIIGRATVVYPVDELKSYLAESLVNG